MNDFSDIKKAINSMNDSSNYDILDNLSQVITQTSGATKAISVGIFSDSAKDSLENTIIEALNKRKLKPTEGELSLRDAADSLKRNSYNYVQSQNEFNKIQKEAWERIERENKQNNKSFSGTLGKIFPKIAIAAEVITKVGKSTINQYAKWINRYEELYNSGVILSDGLDGLANSASNAGLAIDDYVKVLKDNSKLVASLDSKYGKGERTFSNMINQTQEFGEKLGWSKTMTVKAVTSFVDNQKYYYDNSSQGFNSLMNSSQRYMSHLEQLSKATGKTVEQIQKENEALENDIKYKTLIEGNTEKKLQAERLKQLMPSLSNTEIMAQILGFETEETALRKADPIQRKLLEEATRISAIKDDKARHEEEEKLSKYAQEMMPAALEQYKNMAGAIFYDNEYAKFQGGSLEFIQGLHDYSANLAKESQERTDEKEILYNINEALRNGIIVKNEAEEQLYKVSTLGRGAGFLATATGGLKNVSKFGAEHSTTTGVVMNGLSFGGQALFWAYQAKLIKNSLSKFSSSIGKIGETTGEIAQAAESTGKKVSILNKGKNLLNTAKKIPLARGLSLLGKASAWGTAAWLAWEGGNFAGDKIADSKAKDLKNLIPEDLSKLSKEEIQKRFEKLKGTQKIVPEEKQKEMKEKFYQFHIENANIEITYGKIFKKLLSKDNNSEENKENMNVLEFFSRYDKAIERDERAKEKIAESNLKDSSKKIRMFHYNEDLAHNYDFKRRETDIISKQFIEKMLSAYNPNLSEKELKEKIESFKSKDKKSGLDIYKIDTQRLSFETGASIKELINKFDEINLYLKTISSTETNMKRIQELTANKINDLAVETKRENFDRLNYVSDL